MTFTYILIQAIGLLGTGLYFLSYQFKDTKRLFQVQGLAYLCYTLHLFLLSAFTGCFSYILNILRSYCMAGKRAFLKSWAMCAAICLLQLSLLYFTWAGWISLLPIAANIAATIGAYTGNAKKIRIAGIFINSPLWIVYDIIIGSWAGILDELASEASMLLSVVRYGWKELDKESSQADSVESSQH